MSDNDRAPEKRAPSTVLALASLLPQLGPRPPRPIAWKEYPGEWVIVFEDGRKLRFRRAAEPEVVKPAAAPTKGKRK